MEIGRYSLPTPKRGRVPHEQRGGDDGSFLYSTGARRSDESDRLKFSVVDGRRRGDERDVRGPTSPPQNFQVRRIYIRRSCANLSPTTVAEQAERTRKIRELPGTNTKKKSFHCAPPPLGPRVNATINCWLYNKNTFYFAAFLSAKKM